MELEYSNAIDKNKGALTNTANFSNLQSHILVNTTQISSSAGLK